LPHSSCDTAKSTVFQKLLNSCPFKAAQLHGTESPFLSVFNYLADTKALRLTLVPWRYPKLRLRSAKGSSGECFLMLNAMNKRFVEKISASRGKRNNCDLCL